MYKITIEKIEQVKQLVGKKWEICRQRTEGDKVLNVYDYTPEIEKEVEVITKCYEQTIDNLNLANVIAVINDLCKVTL